MGFENTYKKPVLPIDDTSNPNYFYAHTIVPFNFTFTTYNKLMFFIITWLVSIYTPNKLEFNLFYRYI